jgi:hypothetical protein
VVLLILALLGFLLLARLIVPWHWVDTSRSDDQQSDRLKRDSTTSMSRRGPGDLIARTVHRRVHARGERRVRTCEASESQGRQAWNSSTGSAL